MSLVDAVAKMYASNWDFIFRTNVGTLWELRSAFGMTWRKTLKFRMPKLSLWYKTMFRCIQWQCLLFTVSHWWKQPLILIVEAIYRKFQCTEIIDSVLSHCFLKWTLYSVLCYLTVSLQLLTKASFMILQCPYLIHSVHHHNNTPLNLND